jgi:hypothetical protein
MAAKRRRFDKLKALSRSKGKRRKKRGEFDNPISLLSLLRLFAAKCLFC